MPRSKLGLKLTVEALCQKHKFNPLSELIASLKEKDDKGKFVINGRDRIAGLTILINKLRASPKATEQVADSERKIEIHRVNFSLGSQDDGDPGTMTTG